jgi:hypothetical protein
VVGTPGTPPVETVGGRFRVGSKPTEIPIISRWPVASVLVVSGALGFHVGAGAFADWQVAVETAQVVAGLVDYPAGNPFYVYHTKLWTILHQILAVALAAGLSERALSVLVSGLVGMVSFQALSVIAYAISGDVLVAAGASALIFFSRVAEVGAIYPIWLVGTTHTYGIIALSHAALAVGFLGCGWYRTGLFLLALGPAVHPSVGAWVALIAGIVFASDFRRLSSELRPALPAFAAGCGVTLTSLAVQLLIIQDVPAVDPSTTDKYLAAFVSFWDMHRQPVDFSGATVRLNAAALVVGLVWLTWHRTTLSRPVQLLLRFVMGTAALSLTVALLSWIPPDRLPAAFLIAMPGRILNLDVLLFVAMVVGFGGHLRRTWPGALLLGLLAATLLIGNRSGLWMFEGGHQAAFRNLPPSLRPNATNVVLIVALLQLAIAAFRWERRSPIVQPAYAATIALLGAAAVLTWNLERPRHFDMSDRKNDVLYQSLSKRDGLLLTGGDLHLVQLRTRRPILLDGGGLDALPYAIEAAPEMERILREVYGVELLSPPEEARYRGTVPSEFTRQVWEHYSPEQWDRIAERFGVRQVLTPGDWELKLPVVVRKGALIVYDIPDISP